LNRRVGLRSTVATQSCSRRPDFSPNIIRRSLQLMIRNGWMRQLVERVEYLLSFPGGCSPALERRLTDLGGELVGRDTGILGFGNFIGRADLAGVGIDVISTKIGEGGVSRLLQEVSELACNLAFGWGSPTGFVVQHPSWLEV
jgi:hypothetical protein